MNPIKRISTVAITIPAITSSFILFSLAFNDMGESADELGGVFTFGLVAADGGTNELACDFGVDIDVDVDRDRCS